MTISSTAALSSPSQHLPLAQRLRQIPLSKWLPLAGLLLIGLGIVAVLLLSPYQPNAVNLSDRFAPISWQHLLGADQFGRDTLTRLAHGAVLSLGVAAGSLAASFTIGTSIGVLAAWRGGFVATVALTLNDTLVIIPMILVMLGFVAAFGTGTLILAVGMTTLGWVVFARLSYQLTARTLGTGYVEAAIALGADSRRVLLQHIWPNIARPLLTYMALRLPSTLLAFSGLSFLGLGPRPPQAEWGAMIAEARGFADRAPMLLLAPSLIIVLISVLFAALGSNASDIDLKKTK